jgi:hypothetical protein
MAKKSRKVTKLKQVPTKLHCQKCGKPAYSHINSDFYTQWGASIEGCDYFYNTHGNKLFYVFPHKQIERISVNA